MSLHFGAYAIGYQANTTFIGRSSTFPCANIGTTNFVSRITGKLLLAITGVHYYNHTVAYHHNVCLCRPCIVC